MLSRIFRALRLGGVLTSPQAAPSGLQMTPPSHAGTENPRKPGSPDFILIITQGYTVQYICTKRGVLKLVCCISNIQWRDNCAPWRNTCVLWRDTCILWRDTCVLWRDTYELCGDTCVLWRVTCVLWRDTCVLWRDTCVLWRVTYVFWSDVCVLWRDTCVLWSTTCVFWSNNVYSEAMCIYSEGFHVYSEVRCVCSLEYYMCTLKWYMCTLKGIHVYSGVLHVYSEGLHEHFEGILILHKNSHLVEHSTICVIQCNVTFRRILMFTFTLQDFIILCVKKSISVLWMWWWYVTISLTTHQFHKLNQSLIFIKVPPKHACIRESKLQEMFVTAPYYFIQSFLEPCH